MSRDDAVECHGHATMVVGPAIEHVPSCVVYDAYERIVRCRLLIIPVSSPLRHAVKSMAGDNVRSPWTNPGRRRLDPWCPGRIIGSRGVVNRDEEEVGEKNLAGWKYEHIAVERRIVRRVGSRRGCRQAVPVPLQERRRGLKDERACHQQDLAVGLERCGTICDTQLVGEIRTRSPASLETRRLASAAAIGPRRA